jgi:hypothetical protein
MIFNEISVLTNMKHARFFQRVEGGQTLRYYGPIGNDSMSSPSMLKAFVGIILLANDSWFHSSPTLVHTLVDLSQRDRALKQARHYPWLDHTMSCNLIPTFAISTVVLYVVAHNMALH